MVIDNFYYLYRFRKSHNKYPHDYIQLHTEGFTTWLIIGRKLPDEELESFDLQYCGERMTYDQCQKEIIRTSIRR